jgi:U3 small nucleolar RNA-associated protein 7
MAPAGGGPARRRLAARPAQGAPAQREADAAFRRGRLPSLRREGVRDKKAKGELRSAESLNQHAASSAARVHEHLLPEPPGFLEPEPGGVERTSNAQQADILRSVDLRSSLKAFDLPLSSAGPYCTRYTHSGRHNLLAGERGHLLLSQWQKSHLVSEEFVHDTVRDATFLHNDNFFATAQSKCAYIYDKRGLEVHTLDSHTEPVLLDFLPHHFLLVSASKTGILRYQDTTDGTIVVQHRTKAGRPLALEQNPHNSVMCMGHHNGTVSMWTPNMGQPVVRMLTHKGPLRDVAFDQTGTYMVTAGADAQVRVWDIRKYSIMHSYFAAQPPTSIDVSQRGLIAVSWGSRVQIWKNALAIKANSPYMNHTVANGAGHVRNVRFCPYEDVLGVGHSQGMTSMLVPGAGEPNFDAYVANPFENKRQKQEQEVSKLLDKLPPSMIQLEPEAVGKVRKEPEEVQRQKRLEAQQAELSKKQSQLHKLERKNKKKGRAKPTKRAKKKRENIIEQGDIRKKEKQVRKSSEQVFAERKADEERAKQQATDGEALPPGLQRFAKHMRHR